MEARGREGQRNLFLRHFLYNSLKHRRGQIAFAGIRQHAQDHCAWISPLSHLHGDREASATFSFMAGGIVTTQIVYRVLFPLVGAP